MILTKDFTQWLEELNINLQDRDVLSSIKFAITNRTTKEPYIFTENNKGTKFLKLADKSAGLTLYFLSESDLDSFYSYVLEFES